jgi:hypothetical protein
MIHPSNYKTSSNELRGFVQRHHIVMEGGKNAVPSVVRFIVGNDYSGNWWSLPDSSRIYNAIQQIRADESIAICKLIQRKVTFAFRDTWPSLAAIAHLLPNTALDRIAEVHTPSGKHKTSSTSLQDWLPAEIRIQANLMTVDEALDNLRCFMGDAVSLIPLAPQRH